MNLEDFARISSILQKRKLKKKSHEIKQKSIENCLPERSGSHRGPQVGPRLPKSGSRDAQKSPKRRPKSPRGRSRDPQGRSRSNQCAPKSAQRGPERSQRGPRERQNRLQDGLRGRTPPERLQISQISVDFGEMCLNCSNYERISIETRVFCTKHRPARRLV